MRRAPLIPFALALLMVAAPPAAAQAPAGDIASHADWPQAKPEDVASVDAILKALYDVISGGAGEKRDWTRMRSLFVPGARLIPSGPRDGGARSDLRVLSPDDYISRAGPRLEEMGFFEREIARKTETFGSIVHAFSTYESRHKKDDEKPFSRGINSIQLLKDGNRYWVVSIFWDSERPNSPIPEKYLK